MAFLIQIRFIVILMIGLHVSAITDDYEFNRRFWMCIMHGWLTEKKLFRQFEWEISIKVNLGHLLDQKLVIMPNYSMVYYWNGLVRFGRHFLYSIVTLSQSWTLNILPPSWQKVIKAFKQTWSSERLSEKANFVI